MLDQLHLPQPCGGDTILTARFVREEERGDCDPPIFSSFDRVTNAPEHSIEKKKGKGKREDTTALALYAYQIMHAMVGSRSRRRKKKKRTNGGELVSSAPFFFPLALIEQRRRTEKGRGGGGTRPLAYDLMGAKKKGRETDNRARTIEFLSFQRLRQCAWIVCTSSGTQGGEKKRRRGGVFGTFLKEGKALNLPLPVLKTSFPGASSFISGILLPSEETAFSPCSLLLSDQRKEMQLSALHRYST